MRGRRKWSWGAPLLVLAIALTLVGAVGAGTIDVVAAADGHVDGARATDEAGRAVASGGDANGDGIEDYILSAPDASRLGRDMNGVVYVLFGPASPSTVDLAQLGSPGGPLGYAVYGRSSWSIFGQAADFAGDVNGDGRDDVVIGAPQDSWRNGPYGPEETGVAYVVPSPASVAALPTDAGVPYVDTAAAIPGMFAIGGNFDCCEANLGSAVAGAGDVNGDGRDDVVVGEPNWYYDAPGGPYQAAGAAHVVFSPADAAALPIADSGVPVVDPNASGFDGFRIHADDWFDQLGQSVSGVGDMNADGFDDVVVGTLQKEAAYVVFGKATTSEVLVTALGSAGFAIRGTGNSDLGTAVSDAGDVNGDGIPDVLVGAPRADPGGDGRPGGALYVIFGKATATPVDVSALGPQGYWFEGKTRLDCSSGEGCVVVSERIGESVANAGDFDGDGRPDALAGGGDDVFVVFGKAGAGGIVSPPGINGYRLIPDDNGGRSFAGLGDVSGDGRAELLVGMSGVTRNGRDRSGVVVLLFGRAGVPSGPSLVRGTVGAVGFGPLAGASVAACPTAGGPCFVTSSAPDGSYTFATLPEGEYRFTATAPVPSPVPGLLPEIRVLAIPGDDVLDLNLELSPYVGMPPGAFTSPNNGSSSVPMTPSNLGWRFGTTGCEGGTATYEVRRGAAVLWSGTLAESPAGTYAATIAPTMLDAYVHVAIELTCPDGSIQFIEWDVRLYIDPSGTVLDRDGAPIGGATVTLLHWTGDAWAVVPDGSEIMSPENRTNPWTTPATGEFRWDVVPGRYKLAISAPNCQDAEAGPWDIPPPVVGLEIVLDCGDSVPPTVTAPANMDVGTDAGRSYATVDPGTATGDDDNPGVTVAGVRSDGQPLVGQYPLGTTTITWTATDAAGNTATATQTVQVSDREPPVLALPAPITVTATSATGAVVTYTVTATDNVGVAATTCTPASGSPFALGATAVQCTATDAAGNSASGSFNVTVQPKAQTVGEMIGDLVDKLRAKLNLGPLEQALRAKLVSAANAYASRKPKVLCNVLNALENQLRALTRTRWSAGARELLADVRRIQAAAGC